MNAYELLNPEIRRFIYEEGWQALKKIQEASILRAFQTDHNLILAAPTASGKTEAAFLPALNFTGELHDGVKILYISPLIALINDQYKRMTDLCRFLDLPVTSWHGEANVTEKKKLIASPEGILLITPESIEAMLVNRPSQARLLFSRLEWIIVDEIHSFAENNRGVQLKSLLQRILEMTEKTPRFIGMSATMKKEDYPHIKEFFNQTMVTDVLQDKTANPLEATISYYPSTAKVPYDAILEIYARSQEESMLVFPNTKANVEEISVSLKKLAQKRGSHVRYFAHHASMDKHIRREAEEFAKSVTDDLFTICCTSTLELGIDIGSVDSVVQYGAPPSVSTLAQRLGRSGRRTQQQILHLISSDAWAMLQSLAALSLYRKGILDDADIIAIPYDVLAHQIISELVQKSGVKKTELKKTIQGRSCWKTISEADYDALIKFLLEEEYIEASGLEYISGTSAEKLLRSKEFYAHFYSDQDYNVYDSHDKIGAVPYTPAIMAGENIYLSARVWKIQEIETSSKKIIVTPAKDGKPPKFLGTGSLVTGEIRREMERLIRTPAEWSNYDDGIVQMLTKLAEENVKDRGIIWVDGAASKHAVRTFRSTKINRTLLLLLKMIGGDETAMRYLLDDYSSKLEGEDLESTFQAVVSNGLNELDLYEFLLSREDIVDQIFSHAKYMQLVPFPLKVNYIMKNYLDIRGTKEYIEEIRTAAFQYLKV